MSLIWLVGKIQSSPFWYKIDDRVQKVLHILRYAKTSLIAIITQIDWCNTTFGSLNIWISIISIIVYFSIFCIAESEWSDSSYKGGYSDY